MDFLAGCVDKVLVALCMELVLLIATCGVLDTGCGVLVTACGVLMTGCGVGAVVCGAMIGFGTGVAVAGVAEALLFMPRKIVDWHSFE